MAQDLEAYINAFKDSLTKEQARLILELFVNKIPMQTEDPVLGVVC